MAPISPIFNPPVDIGTRKKKPGPVVPVTPGITSSLFSGIKSFLTPKNAQPFTSSTPTPTPTGSFTPQLGGLNIPVPQFIQPPATPAFTPPTTPPQVKTDIPGFATPAPQLSQVPLGPTQPPQAPVSPQIAQPAAPTAPTAPTAAQPAVPATPATSPEAAAAVAASPDPVATQTAVQKAEEAVQANLKISPEALSTQADIDKLIESTKKAFLGTQDQPIPLEFITGQLASIERRALGLIEPLQRKAARLQAARTASLEASKFGLERADKAAEVEAAPVSEAKPFTLSPGQKRFDAQGNVIATGGARVPTAAETAKALAASEKDEVFRASQAQTAGLVSDILADPDFSSVAGSGLGKVFGGLAGFAAIRGKIIQLKALTSLEGREKLKGSGTISDFEAQMLSDSATSINSAIEENGEIKMRESDAIQNLKNIRGALQLKAGMTIDVIVTDPSTGDSQTGPLNSKQVNDLFLQGLLIDFL